MAASHDKEHVFDVRVIDRNLQKKILAEEELKSYTAGLKDCSENADVITKESIFGDEMIHGHKKKYVPAYKGRPQVVYTRAGDSDLEGEEDESEFDSDDAAAAEVKSEGEKGSEKNSSEE